jgi:hypothetical protein
MEPLIYSHVLEDKMILPLLLYSLFSRPTLQCLIRTTTIVSDQISSRSPPQGPRFLEPTRQDCHDFWPLVGAMHATILLLVIWQAHHISYRWDIRSKWFYDIIRSTDAQLALVLAVCSHLRELHLHSQGDMLTPNYGLYEYIQNVLQLLVDPNIGGSPTLPKLQVLNGRDKTKRKGIELTPKHPAKAILPVRPATKTVCVADANDIVLSPRCCPVPSAHSLNRLVICNSGVRFSAMENFSQMQESGRSRSYASIASGTTLVHVHSQIVHRWPYCLLYTTSSILPPINATEYPFSCHRASKSI